MNEEIHISVNGLKETVPANVTISYLIEHFEEDDVHLIVEYNGQFLYPQKYIQILGGESPPRRIPVTL
jgi:sulfur carrier protein ThiS